MTAYDDIIHLPHHVSEKRVQMPLADRAAQFSPFAALTGYDGIIAETGRLTERYIDLDEGAVDELNQQLRKLAACIDRQPTVTALYFLPDLHKDGGSYVTKTGQVKKLDALTQTLCFTDRTEIRFSQLLGLQLPSHTEG